MLKPSECQRVEVTAWPFLCLQHGTRKFSHPSHRLKQSSLSRVKCGPHVPLSRRALLLASSPRESRSIFVMSVASSPSTSSPNVRRHVVYSLMQVVGFALLLGWVVGPPRGSFPLPWVLTPLRAPVLAPASPPRGGGVPPRVMFLSAVSRVGSES